MSIELSIVMPCLNEAETLAGCIRSAHEGAKLAGVERYEIIIADNGSEDGSQEIARSEGAFVVDVPVRGYGAALRFGIEAARGKYVIMGDSDESYDFSNIKPFVIHLREGIQLVMGTRLKGDIFPHAMPAMHRYLGNPILTWLANLLFKTELSDYHCGMRGFDREAILKLELGTEGMEFASEMVIRSKLAGLSEVEIPITYRPDGRSRPPHLRTWQDGWRHLRFMLLYSPRWLFLYPGLLLSIFGLIISSILLVGPIQVGEVVFGVHTLLFTSTLFIIGVQLIFIAIFSRAYAARSGLLPQSPMLERGLDRFSLGLGLVTGLILCITGIALYGVGLVIWGGRDFGPLPNFKHTLRIVILGTTLLILGVQVFFGSFVLSLLSLR
jgi:glycosyltransferase involved in cell wall biosynthesis